ncbi:MAG: iron ABC transporter substrate-binding protein [Anaerolineales bacterium]
MAGSVLAACAPTAAISAAQSDGATGGEDSGLPSQLIVYSGRSEELVGPIIQQFAEATGIDVQVRYGSTAEIAAALLEEGENSPADIFYAQDPGGLGAIEDAGLLASLPAEILGKIDPNFSSSEGKWVGITARVRVVVYNTNALTSDELPLDLNGFTDPAWNGRLGIAPTNSSFLTMITAMRTLWGENETHAWLEGIMENHPVFYENNTAIVAAVGAGEVDAGLVNHYYLYRFLAEEGEGFPARNYYMTSGGPGSLVMVSGAGVLTNGQNQANAERFLEFMLSTVAQQYFASQTFEYPLVDGVVISNLLTPLSELKPPEISMGALADLEETTTLLQDVGMLP